MLKKTSAGRTRRSGAVVGSLGLLLMLVSSVQARPRRPRAKPAKVSPAAAAPAPAPEPAPAPADEKPSAPVLDDEPAAEAPPPAAPAPRTAEAPSEPARPAVDVAKLKAEYDELRDAVFRSRARRETLAAALVSTKMSARVRWKAGRRYTLARAELRLDGTRLWDSNDGPVTEELTLDSRSVAPGAHRLGLRIEVRARDNPKLGYVSDQSFAVSFAEGKANNVKVTIDEDGSPPGSYNPEVEVEIDD